PFGYYDDWYSGYGYYDPSTVTPEEQPTYPTAAYPYVKPPRSSCSAQTYKVPSENGGETSVNLVRCSRAVKFRASPMKADKRTNNPSNFRPPGGAGGGAD